MYNRQQCIVLKKDSQSCMRIWRMKLLCITVSIYKPNLSWRWGSELAWIPLKTLPNLITVTCKNVYGIHLKKHWSRSAYAHIRCNPFGESLILEVLKSNYVFVLIKHTTTVLYGVAFYILIILGRKLIILMEDTVVWGSGPYNPPPPRARCPGLVHICKWSVENVT